MITELLQRLMAPTPKPLPQLDTRLALGAILVRVAKSDRDYAVEEIRRIDRILARSFGINTLEAAQLRADAERLEAEAPDDGRFAKAIAAAVPVSERETVLTAMWQIALADGVKRLAEEQFMERAGERLGLDAAAVARARASAAGKTVIPNLGNPPE